MGLLVEHTTILRNKNPLLLVHHYVPMEFFLKRVSLRKAEREKKIHPWNCEQEVDFYS